MRKGDNTFSAVVFPFKGQFEVHLYTKLICPLQSMAQGMAKSGRITSDLKCMKLYW